MSMEYVGPFLVVAGCIVMGDSVILARREDPEIVGEYPKWELPGGKVEFGETPEETLQREILEELNLEVKPLSLIPHIQTNLWEKAGIKKHYAIVCYDSTPVESDILSLRRQLPSKAALFRKDQIDFSKTLPGTQEFIAHSSLLGKKVEEVMACFIRLEPAESIKGHLPLAYIEIRVLPSNLPNCLGIYIVIGKKQSTTRLQVPPPLRSYIYTKRHTKSSRAGTRVLEEGATIQEFSQITNSLGSEGYVPTKFYGHTRFLHEIKALA